MIQEEAFNSESCGVRSHVDVAARTLVIERVEYDVETFDVLRAKARRHDVACGRPR